MSKEKTLIIGGGQAACQTVTALKSKGYQGKIKIHCSENYLPYQRPPLSKKFLLGELDKERLFFKPGKFYDCLLYTSPSPRDGLLSRMPSSA